MDVQSCRATTAPVGEEDVCWARHRVRHHTRSLLGGGQGSGPGSSEDHVSNGIMARDAVARARMHACTHARTAKSKVFHCRLTVTQSGIARMPVH